MKKIFPFAMIAIFGASYFTSCTKNNNNEGDNSSYYCDCGYKSVRTGADSVVSGVTYGYNWSAGAAATQCGLHQDTLQITYPNITCGIGF